MKHFILIASICAALLGCAQQPDTPTSNTETRNTSDYQTVKIGKLPNHGYVCVKARLVKVYDQNEVVLKDGTGKVDIFTHHHNMQPYYYDEVIVKGRVDHSKWKEMLGVRKEINANYLILPNGKTIDLQ